jgi:PhnB protein
MPILDSYLFFDGNCAEAMRFYERVTGGKLTAMMKYSENPDGEQYCPPGSADRIMHACVMIDGRNLMASDSPAGQFKPQQGVSLSLFYDTPAEAKKAFEQFAEGGSIEMPLAETFWAQIFGAVTDRFGTSWMVGGGAKMPPPAA